MDLFFCQMIALFFFRIIYKELKSEESDEKGEKNKVDKEYDIFKLICISVILWICHYLQ